MIAEQRLLEQAYSAFNRRDLALMETLLHSDVDWPNGWEGGYLHGRATVRDYWMRQWAAINPSVEPQHFAAAPDGRIVVDVHQVVRDQVGTILSDQMIQHVYRIEDDLIRSMEIRQL